MDNSRKFVRGFNRQREARPLALARILACYTCPSCSGVVTQLGEGLGLCGSCGAWFRPSR